MIRLGSQIRLTQKEIEYFRWLTDIEPAGIRTCGSGCVCGEVQGALLGRVAGYAVPPLDDRPGGRALPGGVSLPQEIGPLACPWGEAPHSPSHAARGMGYMAQPVA